MVKYIYFFILFTTNLYSLEGMILVLKAPAFEKPDPASRIVQYFDQGDLVYLHEKYRPKNHKRIQQSFLEDDIDLAPDSLEIKQKSDNDPESFYMIQDRRGNTSYLKKKHVYVYYETLHEVNESIKLNSQSELKQNIDETDYRPESELADTFPFYSYKEQGILAQFQIMLGEQSRDNYPYNSSLTSRDYSNTFQVQFNFARNISPRIQFGMGVYLASQQNSFEYEDTSTSENELSYAVGPIVKFVLYNHDKTRYSLNTSAFLARRAITIKQNSSSETDDGSFTGFVPAVSIQPYYENKNVFWDFDFILGVQLFSYIPHTLKRSGGSNTRTSLWNPNDTDFIEAKFSIETSLLFGIQKVY